MSFPTVICRHEVWRIISTRFPPISLFEDVADAADFDALHELESRTNARLRDELGQVELVPPEERVYGSGSGYIMAAFTHLNRDGSRFSDGTFGVFYAALTTETAIHETRYHRAKFLSYTDESPQEIDMRVLRASLNATLHEIAGAPEVTTKIYALDDYTYSQAAAKELRKQNSQGIKYNSVRDEGGICFAIFRANTLSDCIQTQHLCYVWDGNKITQVYEKRMISD